MPQESLPVQILLVCTPNHGMLSRSCKVSRADVTSEHLNSPEMPFGLFSEIAF